LESIFPVLRKLAGTRRFRLKIVGANVEKIELPGIEVENLKWSLEREIADFQSFDIGLYPMVADEWSSGKSGFKAIQYMAVGIPYVVTPVAACAEIGIPGETHLAASTPNEWHSALENLLDNWDVRRSMGKAGREHALEFYNLPLQSERLATALRTALDGKGAM
jgi:glycosyltransferase involved in cell wall biosynthesis